MDTPKPRSVTTAGAILLGAGLWSGFLALTLTAASMLVWIPAYTCGILCAAYATLMGILLLAGVKTGRGLAISHRGVSQAGGELSVESVEGNGATFRVKLPMAPVVAA